MRRSLEVIWQEKRSVDIRMSEGNIIWKMLQEISYNLSVTPQWKDRRTIVACLTKIPNSMDFNLYSQKDTELQQERYWKWHRNIILPCH